MSTPIASLNPPDLLHAKGLFKGYGRIPVLKNVDIAIAPGQAHVVIGPNGAGKTTLFKVLTGELTPDQGNIVFQGQDITRLQAHQRVLRGFGRTFQVARVFPLLTVRDNLQLAFEARERHGQVWSRLNLGTLTNISHEVNELLEDAGLQAHADFAAGAQAYGDRKRLELAMVLALRPQVLFLDEPTAGMSAAERQATVQLLRKVRTERKLALLLTEHDMDVVFGLADCISVLHHGELIASGSPESIRNDAHVREVYLGEEEVHA